MAEGVLDLDPIHLPQINLRMKPWLGFWRPLLIN